jgi:hypothetical protein
MAQTYLVRVTVPKSIDEVEVTEEAIAEALAALDGTELKRNWSDDDYDATIVAEGKQPDFPATVAASAPLRFTVRADPNRTVQVWGTVSGHSFRATDGVLTNMDVSANRVYDTGLREAMLEIDELRDRATGQRRGAYETVLNILERLQPVDNGQATVARSKEDWMQRGWWTLSFTGVTELTDEDREHIAASIIDGNREGEIVQDTDGQEIHSGQ